MPSVKRKTTKRAAASKRAKPKTNRAKTTKRAVKKAVKRAKKRTPTVAEKLHAEAQKKRKSAAKKAAATRKANAEKAKRSAAAKKGAATRKAKSNAKTKVPAKGKTKKRAATKKTARPARKRTHVDGRSREAKAARGGRTYLKECAKLLLQRKHTDIEIRDKLAELFGLKYSGGKHTRHIRKYRSLLNSGGLEHAGFKQPSKPVQEIGRTRGAEEAGLSRRQARRRRCERIEKGLVLGPRARARARRLQAAGSSPDGAHDATVGSSSPDAVQPIARLARRR